MSGGFHTHSASTVFGSHKFLAADESLRQGYGSTQQEGKMLKEEEVKSYVEGCTSH